PNLGLRWVQRAVEDLHLNNPIGHTVMVPDEMRDGWLLAAAYSPFRLSIASNARNLRSASKTGGGSASARRCASSVLRPRRRVPEPRKTGSFRRRATISR